MGELTCSQLKGSVEVCTAGCSFVGRQVPVPNGSLPAARLPLCEPARADGALSPRAFILLCYLQDSVNVRVLATTSTPADTTQRGPTCERNLDRARFAR